MVYLSAIGNWGRDLNKLQEELEWDHIVPMSLLSTLASGTNGLPMHVFANFGLLEKTANRVKAGKDPRTFINAVSNNEEREHLEQMLIFKPEWLGEEKITATTYVQFLHKRAQALFKNVISEWAPE
jgi:hypothetical protein